MISRERLAELREEEDTNCKSFYTWITGGNVSQEELFHYVAALLSEIADLKAQLDD